jgi:ferredoxin
MFTANDLAVDAATWICCECRGCGVCATGCAESAIEMTVRPLAAEDGADAREDQHGA